jgi:hypothetical protein
MTIFHISKEKTSELEALFSGRCEWCDREYPPHSLVLHYIVPDKTVSGTIPLSPDPQKRFLLLCSGCHQELHEIPLPYHLQKDLVRARPQELRKAIREVLGYIPAPYQPPGDFDLAEIYEDCFSLRSLNLFRAGG